MRQFTNVKRLKFLALFANSLARVVSKKKTEKQQMFQGFGCQTEIRWPGQRTTTWQVRCVNLWLACRLPVKRQPSTNNRQTDKPTNRQPTTTTNVNKSIHQRVVAVAIRVVCIYWKWLERSGLQGCHSTTVFSLFSNSLSVYLCSYANDAQV